MSAAEALVRVQRMLAGRRVVLCLCAVDGQERWRMWGSWRRSVWSVLRAWGMRWSVSASLPFDPLRGELGADGVVCVGTENAYLWTWFASMKAEIQMGTEARAVCECFWW